MFELIGKALYQWDLDRQIEVTDDSVSEVHFAHPGDENALVVEVDEIDGVRVASIPNILLQGYAPIKVWLVVGDVTVYGNKLTVTGRAKPDDYVYTETEVKRYETLEKRIEALEQNGGGGSVDLSEIEADITELQEDVGKLSEDKADKSDTYTKAEVDDIVQNIPSGEGGNVDLSEYVKFTDYSTESNCGVVKVKRQYGTNTDNGTIYVVRATNGEIDLKENQWKPIVPYNLDYAVKKGLTTNALEWTADEKASARDRMGLGWRYIDTIEVADVSQIEITFPQEYDEFMIVGDVEGTGSSTVYPICAYFGETGNLLDRTVLFSDFYPSDKKEHFELTFEKATFENEVLFRMSGFEKTDFNPTKLKQNLMTTGWFDMYDTANRIPCHGWWGVRIARTITSASFNLYAR